MGRKIILLKSSALSDKEKAEARAKKFGTALQGKKEEANLEVLKRRAIRFQTNSSPNTNQAAHNYMPRGNAQDINSKEDTSSATPKDTYKRKSPEDWNNINKFYNSSTMSESEPYAKKLLQAEESSDSCSTTLHDETKTGACLLTSMEPRPCNLKDGKQQNGSSKENISSNEDDGPNGKKTDNEVNTTNETFEESDEEDEDEEDNIIITIDGPINGSTWHKQLWETNQRYQNKNPYVWRRNPTPYGW